MRFSLQKKADLIYVGYKSGGGIKLWAESFSAEASEFCVTLSMDLSKNQSPRKRDSHAFHDAESLLTKLDRVEFIQLHTAKWMEAYAKIVSNYPEAKRNIELTFKGGVSCKFDFVLRATGGSGFFYVNGCVPASA